LSETGGGAIEKVMNILLEVEAALEEMKVSVDQKKQELRDIAKVAGERAGQEVINEISSGMEKELDEARNKANMEAQSILKNNEKNVKQLRKNIDDKFQAAVELVIRRVVGD
jgi:vacuolar-type H+-ATPase subunit H